MTRYSKCTFYIELVSVIQEKRKENMMNMTKVVMMMMALEEFLQIGEEEGPKYGGGWVFKTQNSRVITPRVETAPV